MEKLRQSFSDLADSSESLWRQYLQLGPGRLPPDSFMPIESAIRAIRVELEKHPSLSSDAWCSEFNKVSDELELLLRRCVERAEGLCFVTGEAGLIPRRDLHDRCEEALATLGRLKSRLHE